MEPTYSVISAEHVVSVGALGEEVVSELSCSMHMICRIYSNCSILAEENVVTVVTLAVESVISGRSVVTAVDVISGGSVVTAVVVISSPSRYFPGSGFTRAKVGDAAITL